MDADESQTPHLLVRDLQQVVPFIQALTNGEKTLTGWLSSIPGKHGFSLQNSWAKTGNKRLPQNVAKELRKLLRVSVQCFGTSSTNGARCTVMLAGGRTSKGGYITKGSGNSVKFFCSQSCSNYPVVQATTASVLAVDPLVSLPSTPPIAPQPQSDTQPDPTPIPLNEQEVVRKFNEIILWIRKIHDAVTDLRQGQLTLSQEISVRDAVHIPVSTKTRYDSDHAIPEARRGTNGKGGQCVNSQPIDVVRQFKRLLEKELTKGWSQWPEGRLRKLVGDVLNTNEKNVDLPSREWKTKNEFVEETIAKNLNSS